MNYSSNVIVLVCAEKRNRLVIWDCHDKKARTEITFNHDQDILGLKVRKDMICVALLEKTFVFNFVTLKLIQQLETIANP